MTGGQDTRSARCVETRTAGAAGGPGKPTGSNPGRAPRSDPTGRFYRTALNGLLRRISTYLVRWARQKYRRLRTYKKARKWWDGLTERQPATVCPLGMDDRIPEQPIDETSGVTGDCHAPFRGSLEVRSLQATRLDRDL